MLLYGNKSIKIIFFSCIINFINVSFILLYNIITKKMKFSKSVGSENMLCGLACLTCRSA